MPGRTWMIGHERICKYSWYDRRRRSLETMRSNVFTGIEDDQEEPTINQVDLDTEQGGDAQSRQTGWPEPDRGIHDREKFSSFRFKSGMIFRPVGNAGTIL